MNNEIVHERESNIELLRILGTFLVIATHIQLPYLEAGVINNERMIIASFLCDGVNVFWLIMGFFLIKNYNAQGRIYKIIRKVAIPSVVVVIVSYLIWANAMNIGLSVENFIRDICSWSGFMLDMGGHLWFVVWYVKNAILWVPILYAIFNEKRARKLFLCTTIIALTIADMMNLGGRGENIVFRYFTLIGEGNLLVSSLCIFIGTYLYSIKNIFEQKRKIWSIIGIGTFVIANLVRYSMTNYTYACGNENDYFQMWYSGVGQLASCGLAIAFLCIRIKDRWSKVINVLGKHTFNIYLLHILVINILTWCGIKNYFMRHSYGAYIVAFSSLIFAICCLCSLCIEKIISKIFESIKYKVADFRGRKIF